MSDFIQFRPVPPRSKRLLASYAESDEFAEHPLVKQGWNVLALALVTDDKSFAKFNTYPKCGNLTVIYFQILNCDPGLGAGPHSMIPVAHARTAALNAVDSSNRTGWEVVIE